MSIDPTRFGQGSHFVPTGERRRGGSEQVPDSDAVPWRSRRGWVLTSTFRFQPMSEIRYFYSELNARVVSGQVGDILVAETACDDRHLLVPALTGTEVPELLDQVDLALAADVGHIRHPADAVQTMTGLALPGLVPAGRRIGGTCGTGRTKNERRDEQGR